MSNSLGDLARHLRELEKFTNEVNALAASVNFDAENAASIEAAMAAADQHIDQVAGRYSRNALVKKYARQVKSQIREQILEQAASSRLEHNEDADMTPPDDVRDYLSEIAETVLELQSADYQTIQRPMKTLARLLRAEMVRALILPLTQGIDLKAWLNAGMETQGSMVGSAVLAWPESVEAELGTTILLIERMAEDSAFLDNFSYSFYYAGTNYTSTTRKMVGGLIVPFERKFARHVKAQLQVPRTPTSPSAIMNNITINNSQVGAVQTGNDNVAHVNMSVSQHHTELSESLGKLAEQLKPVDAIPGHDKSEIIELIDDSRAELNKEKPSKAKLTALLSTIGAAVSSVSNLGGAYIAVQTAAALAGFSF